MTKPTFADVFPLEVFKVVVDNECKRDDQSQAAEAERQKVYNTMMDGAFKPSVIKHLAALKEQGVLKPIANAEGRSTWFMDAWNAMASDNPEFRKNPDQAWGRIAAVFGHSLLFRPMYRAAKAIKDGAVPETAIADGYADLVDKIDRGQIPWHEVTENEQCEITDARLRIEVDGWDKVIMGTIGPRGELVPMEAIAVRPPITSAEVEFKTGNLLIADWFRIDEFTKRVKNQNQYGEGTRSLNSVAGREDETVRCLKEFGFIKVSVGNSSPQVMAIDNTLTVGHIDDEQEAPDGVQDLGMVCTDLWWTTIIEKERLAEIVAETVGPEDAAKMVDAYIEEHGTFITQVKVAPGTHHLYFSGDEEIFRERFRSNDVAIPSAVEPMFILSNRPLTLQPVGPEEIAEEVEEDCGDAPTP